MAGGGLAIYGSGKDPLSRSTGVPMMKVIAFLIAFFLGATAAAEAPLVVAPYKVSEEGAVIVEATVNGAGPFPFILDTGATLTLAFENLRAKADLRPGSGNKRILALSGAETHPTALIGDIALGQIVLNDHVGAILPDWEAPRETPAGVIGIDFIGKYALLFDVDARTISFYPRGGLPKEEMKRWRSTLLSPVSIDEQPVGIFLVNGRVNGEPGRFVIDLGLSTTLLNYRFAEAIYANQIISGSGLAGTTGSRINDLFDDRTRVSSATLRTIMIAGVRWRRPNVLVFNAPLFDELGVQRLPLGLLGADILMRQDFAIDFANGRLYFGQS